jgi:hypothetical protein
MGNALTLLQDVITNGGFVFNPNAYAWLTPGVYLRREFSLIAIKTLRLIKKQYLMLCILRVRHPFWGQVILATCSAGILNYLIQYQCSGALGTPSVSNDLLKVMLCSSVDTRGHRFYIQLHTTTLVQPICMHFLENIWTQQKSRLQLTVLIGVSILSL